MRSLREAGLQCMRLLERSSMLWVVLLIVVILLFSAAFDMIGYGTALPKAHNGRIDLSAWHFAEDGNIKLDGKWEFFWRKLLTYKDFNKGKTSPDLYADVPDVWTSYSLKGAKLPSEGYGTYRLRVKCGAYKNRLLGMYLNPMASSYVLWVNDKKVAASGVVGSSANQAVPRFKPRTVFFQAPAEEFDIIVQVANFSYARGGLWYSIYLGDNQTILNFQNELNGKEIFLIGALFMIGLYSLSIYALRRESKFSLYFAGLCFLLIIVEDVLGQAFILNLFPSMSFEAFNRIWYLSIIWAPFMLVLFINEIFPAPFSKTVGWTFLSITGLISLIDLFTPVSFSSREIIASNLIPVTEVAYTILLAVLAARRKVEGSRLYIIGMLIAMTTLVHDILFINNVIDSNFGTLMFIGAFCLIFAQTVMQAKRFTASFRDKEVLLEKLHVVDRLKDEFLANTSHELRTPLNGIINIASGLLVSSKEHEHKRGLSLIVASGRRLANLVNDILDYSKLKHNDINISREAVELKSVVEVVLTVLRHGHSKPVELINGITDSGMFVYADKDRLFQIFYNLIGNAIKFTEQGYVKVTVQATGEMVEICIEDTGTGIPPEKLKDIFISFEQLDSSLREYAGTGLGLPITKRLVELHGGDIRVTSIPGQGSKFYVSLPVALAKASNSEIAAGLTEIAVTLHTKMELPFKLSQGGAHILLVDDDPTNLYAAVSILRQQGYSITAVSQAKDALAIAKQDLSLSLVILDVMMPEISGYEICAEIRKCRSISDLPVLMATAKTAVPDLVAGFKAGANDYLHKPFEAEELVARVRTLVELKKSVDKTLQAELKFLQSQIRPHFIHNALNTIVSVSRRDPDRSRKLLVKFSDYLRNCFDFVDLQERVPIEREMNFVRSYVALEQARFGEKMIVHWDIDEISCAVPPLILQPLVENAIIHGLRPKPQGGSILIYVKQIKDKLRLGVKDDGAGISTVRLADLAKENKTDRGVGIHNINQRLKKLYHSSLIIESKEGKGTDVYMEIPLEGVKAVD